MILQHGQSWTFECRYKLNSWGDGEYETVGIPVVNPEIVVEDEIEFEFNYFADDTFNKVRVKYLINFGKKIFQLRPLNGQSSI